MRWRKRTEKVGKRQKGTGKDGKKRDLQTPQTPNVESKPKQKEQKLAPLLTRRATARIIGYWWIGEVGITKMDDTARRKKRIVGVVGLVLVILLLILYEPPFRLLNLIEFLIGGLLVGLVANFIFRRMDRQTKKI